MAVAACSGGPAPVPVAVPSADPAAARVCATLHQALPDRLEDLQRRETSPTSSRTAAWGDPPVQLRCAVTPPAQGGTALRVDGVAWLQILATDSVRWFTIDRTVNVELVVPKSYPDQGALLVDLVGPVKQALPQAPPPTAGHSH